MKRSEEHTSELQSHVNLVCRLLLEKKKTLVKSGNFVNNEETILTTLLPLDQIYVSFDGDENVYLKYTELSFDGLYVVFFFNDTATTEIYTLSLHDALPI